MVYGPGMWTVGRRAAPGTLFACLALAPGATPATAQERPADYHAVASAFAGRTIETGNGYPDSATKTTQTGTIGEGFAVYVSQLLGADALKYLGAPGKTASGGSQVRSMNRTGVEP